MEVKTMVVEIKMIFIMQEDSLGSLWRRSQRSADDGRKGLIKCGMGKSTNFKGEQALTKKKKKEFNTLRMPTSPLDPGVWKVGKWEEAVIWLCHLSHIEYNALTFQTSMDAPSTCLKMCKETVPQTCQVWLESMLSSFSLLDFCQTYLLLDLIFFSPIIFNTYLSKKHRCMC